MDSSWMWFALALINAGLAEQKGRSRWAWFLISLLLGPFATGYIVMAARVEPVLGGSTGGASVSPYLGLWAFSATLIVAAALCGAFAFSTPWLWFLAGGLVAAALLTAAAGWKVRAVVTSGVSAPQTTSSGAFRADK